MIDDLFVPIGCVEKVVLAAEFQRTAEGMKQGRNLITALINQAIDLCAGKADGSNRIFTQDGIRFAIDLSINRKLRETALSSELREMTDVRSIQGYLIEATCEVVRPVIHAATLHIALRPDAARLIKQYHHQVILLGEQPVLGVSAISDLQAFTLAVKGMIRGNQDPSILHRN